MELLAVIFCIALPISPPLFEEIPEVLGVKEIILVYADRLKLLLPSLRATEEAASAVD